MKHLLLTTITAVLLVGCGESQQSAPTPETKPEPPTAKEPDISIHDAAQNAEINKTELTSESAVGYYKWPFMMTLLIHKNGTCTTIVGARDEDVISGTWSIKDGKIEVNNDAPDVLTKKNVVKYKVLDNGNLVRPKKPMPGELIKGHEGHTIESYLELMGELGRTSQVQRIVETAEELKADGN